MPQMRIGDFTAACAMGALYGMTPGGFVPLSASMPLLVPGIRAAAISALGLGAGASTWVGPAIVAIGSASPGVGGIIWIFVGLYALSAALMIPVRDPAHLQADAAMAAVH